MSDPLTPEEIVTRDAEVQKFLQFFIDYPALAEDADQFDKAFDPPLPESE
ncbi:hypothetical protein [Rhizobium esperanzae]|nr:hypothetical protein [Rhizobium esperanzae]